MYCPSCGTEANDQTKYCVKCGVNLRRVKGVLGKGGAGFREENDWDQGLLSSPSYLAAYGRGFKEENDSDQVWEARRARGDERKKRADERRNKTPEEKRLNEIKAGVIVSSVGFGLMVFLSLLFSAIASTMDGPEANILRSLWAVGLVPFMIGLGILFNGFFISKRIVNLKRQQAQADQQQHLFSAPNTAPVARHFPSQIEPAQPPISDFSVTETTTTKLREPVSAPSPRDTN
jgi:hypothetical protein